MNDQILKAIEQTFAELDAETTTTDYPTQEIVLAIERRTDAVAVAPEIRTRSGIASALLTTFYAGALWRERALLGSGDTSDMRETLLAAARGFIASSGGVKRAEAVAILTEFFNAEENTIATEDEIEDCNGNPIYVGAKIDAGPAGDGRAAPEPGTVIAVYSCSERDGHPPTFKVEFPVEGEGMVETHSTSVRDFANEGPDGPFVFVADDAEVVFP